MHERRINQYPPVIDILVEVVFGPNEIRNGKAFQRFFYGNSNFGIATIVSLIAGIFVRGVKWQISCASAVGFRWFARLSEIPYQALPVSIFLLLQTKDTTHISQ